MPGLPLDRISIRNIRVFAKHGVRIEEKEREQEFLIDLDIDIDAEEAIRSDDLTKTVDYSFIAEKTSKIVKETSYNLLETLASKIAESLMEIEPIQRIKVQVKKTSPWMPVEVGYVGVTVTRGRVASRGERVFE